MHIKKQLAAVGLLFMFLSSPASAEVIVAEDFLYAQPTKEFGAGGGFTRQDYGGGQNGPLGSWEGQWVSFGDGVITGSDLSEETFNPETDMFSGVTRRGLSDNWLTRDFSTVGLEDNQTLYFGISMRTSDETLMPNATFSISDPRGPGQIGMGFTQSSFHALLGVREEGDDFGVFFDAEEELLNAGRLIGKLEVNASGDDERLTVWLDPTDVETAEYSIAIESDVIGGLSDLTGNVRLDHSTSPGLLFWDDLAVGTTWESVSTVDVPRITVLADNDSRDVRFKNETGSEAQINFIQIESEAGLWDNRWESLADQGLGGFQENNPSAARLTESSLSSALPLSDGASVGWGRVFRNRTIEDLVAHIGTTDGLLNVANVVYGPIAEEPSSVDPDFDDDGNAGIADINALCSQIAAGANEAAFDLTGDGAVNADDLNRFLEQVNRQVGDVNLDGEVDFNDFLTLSTNFGQTSLTWTHGDLDCDGEVAFADFLTLSANFGGSAAQASVPEPSANVLALFSLIWLAAACRRGWLDALSKEERAACRADHLLVRTNDRTRRGSRHAI